MDLQNAWNCLLTLRYFSINSTKLKDFQSIIGSLGQFLFMNFNFSKLAICKWHLNLNLLICQSKKNCYLFQFEIIQCLIFGKPKNQQWDTWICASPTMEANNWYPWWPLSIFWKFATLLPISFVIGSLVLVVGSKISNSQSFQPLDLHNHL